jgi:Flp pilus assembly protein TadD
VLGLRGQLAEAESIIKEGVPPEEAAANVANLRRMLAKRANAKDSDNTASIGVARPQ